MPTSRSVVTWRRLGAVVIGLVLATAPGRMLAAPGAPDTAAAPVALDEMPLPALYTLGETRFHAGELDGAIDAFSAGRARLGDEDDRRLHAYFSVSLAIALLDRFDAAGDVDDAARAKTLLDATVTDDAMTLASEPRLEALARRNLERARAAVPEPAPDPVSADPFGTDPSDGGGTTRAPTPDPVTSVSAKTLRRRRAGMGLLVAGSALLVGGAAVVIDGATLERRARAIAETPLQGRQKEYIEQEVPRLANIRYGIGAPILAISTALIITGAILLRRNGDRATAWRRWGRSLAVRR